MNILIDIGHPAHVHLFKRFAERMDSRGHSVLFTFRDREFVGELLNELGFDSIRTGPHFQHPVFKLLGLFIHDVKLLCIARKFKPTLFLSCGSMYAAQVAFLTGKPHVTLEDTGNMEQINLYKPFTKVILTPSCFHKNLGYRQLRYPSYHELAYLAPGFYSPDPAVLEKHRINSDGPVVLIRFVSWKASHDFGKSGLYRSEKIGLVRVLKELNCTVRISSDRELPEELVQYRLKIPPHEIHDVLAAIDLYIGEGATMASECAMLGTPAIYINPIEADTINEQENYGLLFHFRNYEGVIDKVKAMLRQSDLKEKSEEKRRRMLSEKISLTPFLVWFIEKYPESHNQMKANPSIQQKFKF